MLPAALVPQVEHIITKVCTHSRWRMTSLEERKQECWVRILTYWPSFTAKKSSLDTWLWNQCYFACLDLQRHQHRIGPGKEWNASGVQGWSHEGSHDEEWELALRLPDTRASPEEIVDAKEDLWLYLIHVLRRMSEVEGRAIGLRSWILMKTMADALNMTTWAIFYRHHYGREWPVRMRKIDRGPMGHWTGYCWDVMKLKLGI